MLRPKGPYAGRREVSITLGETNRENGIVQRDQADGKTKPVRLNGKTARSTIPTRHGGRYIYFNVADEFYWAEGTPLILEITFSDRTTSIPMGVDYDSTDSSALHQGAFKRATPIAVKGAGAWKTARLRLEDAAFTGRSNGADFRLADPRGSLAVHRVVVKKADASAD